MQITINGRLLTPTETTEFAFLGTLTALCLFMTFGTPAFSFPRAWKEIVRILEPVHVEWTGRSPWFFQMSLDHEDPKLGPVLVEQLLVGFTVMEYIITFVAYLILWMMIVGVVALLCDKK